MLSRKRTIFSLLLVFSLGICSPFGIRINVSDSLPYRLFISRKLETVRRDAYVSFFIKEGRYPLVKQIVGIPGDQVENVSGSVFVNGKDRGKVLEKTPSGNIVSPINCKKIPEGHVFVSASHENSFDSRYNEFGLIPIDQIQEELWPVF